MLFGTIGYKELKPSNDLCESILGLNDYLTTAIPNLHQLSRSSKKEQDNPVVPAAPKGTTAFYCRINRRAEVAKRYKEEEAIRSLKRREKMVRDEYQRDVLEQRKRERGYPIYI